MEREGGKGGIGGGMYCPSSLSFPPPPPVVVKRVVNALGVLVKQNIYVGRALGEWKGEKEDGEGKGKEREGEGEGEGERFLVVLIDLLRFWRERNICLVGPLIDLIHNCLVALPREKEEEEKEKEKGEKKEGEEEKAEKENEEDGDESEKSPSSSIPSSCLIPLLSQETLGGVGGVLGMVLPESTHTTTLQIIKYLSLRKV